MAEPIFVETDIDHGDEAANGAMKVFPATRSSLLS